MSIREHITAIASAARQLGATAHVHLGIVDRERLTEFEQELGGSRHVDVFDGDEKLGPAEPYTIEAWVTFIDGVEVMAQAHHRPATGEELRALAEDAAAPRRFAVLNAGGIS